jgi:hypothetical protein
MTKGGDTKWHFSTFRLWNFPAAEAEVAAVAGQAICRF